MKKFLRHDGLKNYNHSGGNIIEILANFFDIIHKLIKRCSTLTKQDIPTVRGILYIIMSISHLLASALQPFLIRAGRANCHKKSSREFIMRYHSVISKLFRSEFEKVLSNPALDDAKKLSALNQHVEEVNRDCVNKESELAAQLKLMKMTKLRKVDEIILKVEKELSKRIENKFDNICKGSGNIGQPLLHFINVNRGLLTNKVIMKYIRNKNFIGKSPKSILDLLEMSYQPYGMIAISTICNQLKNFNSNSAGSGDLLKYLRN